ncbi:Mu transposase C-terminal domain-containing protein [Streptomyces sp. NPDC050704]|uniref:Mu transposase C-terminal domain-containing protein n=1 Tax=Streptomyces sp. NPDC050704 TaxID=3157219 RepID=UPI0034469B10
MSPQEYVELLPRRNRTLNAYGFKVNHRVYDGPELDDLRRAHLGGGPKGRRWDVHYDPYDISRIWVRDPRTREWITLFWRHLHTAPVPMGDLVWNHARKTLAEQGRPHPAENEIARTAMSLMNRISDGPGDGCVRDTPRSAGARRRERRVAARTQATASACCPRPHPPAPTAPESAADEETSETAEVIPLGLFDPRKDPWGRS